MRAKQLRGTLPEMWSRLEQVCYTKSVCCQRYVLHIPLLPAGQSLRPLRQFFKGKFARSLEQNVTGEQAFHWLHIELHCWMSLCFDPKEKAADW